MIKSLDTKLAGGHANPSESKAFIIADASGCEGPRPSKLPAIVDAAIES